MWRHSSPSSSEATFGGNSDCFGHSRRSQSGPFHQRWWCSNSDGSSSRDGQSAGFCDPSTCPQYFGAMSSAIWDVRLPTNVLNRRGFPTSQLSTMVLSVQAKMSSGDSCRVVGQNGQVHTSLVMSKTKVAPIKRLTIPRLELCGAYILALLLHHCETIFKHAAKHQKIHPVARKLPSCPWGNSTLG